MSQRRFAAAVPDFLVAMKTENPISRLQASISFVDVMRRIGIPKRDILAFLDDVVADAMVNRDVLDSATIQTVLMARARTHDRIPDRNLDGARDDLLAAAELTPAGAKGADALLLLARLYEWEGSSEQAREVYSDLRMFRDASGRNGRLESAYYFGAHLEYRTRPEIAVELFEALRSLTEEDLFDPFYTGSRFWLARLYQEIGREGKAKRVFAELADNRPFDFYGLRARMHLNVGPDASRMLLLDDQSERFVRRVYSTVQAATASVVRDEDRRLQRVNRALDGGVYEWAYQETSRLFESGETRFRAADTVALAEAGLIGAIAVWRSIRHDALNSVALRNDPRLRIDVATKFADLGDWSTSLLLLARWGRTLDQDGYLAASYPGAFRVMVAQAAAKSKRVPPELLYAVMHAESRLSTRAISPTGALGLLQFQPQTVRSFPPGRHIQKWGKDLEGSLADSEFSIFLGAQWFEKILEANGGSIPLAVMEHNAGDSAVSRWFGAKSGGQGGGGDVCADDLELCVEMARSVQTRRFLREVLATMSIVKAAGIFGASQGG